MCILMGAKVSASIQIGNKLIIKINGAVKKNVLDNVSAVEDRLLS